MWGFYGRQTELAQLKGVLERRRWFFVKVTGRRRIGKTALIREALERSGTREVLYFQVPDSGPAGVVSAAVDAMELFGIDPAKFPRPTTLSRLASSLAGLARAGFVVALDEFQYFNRERLSDFPSLLQREVDGLAAKAEEVPGGLLVLVSIHTDISALLEDKKAPLFNRTTDELDLTHLDTPSILEILREHSDPRPKQLLFLWTLFEGVPKFYRDCFEQGVLKAPRQALLRKLFFESSSPLRTEADNWFLKELRGRYDVVLKYVARKAGCTNGEITDHVHSLNQEEDEQVAGYLKILIEKYRLVAKKLPIFSSPKARGARYYLTDNFLSAWLAALASPVSALSFRPIEALVADADRRLMDVEGSAFEKLVAQLYEERSRRAVGDFPLSERVQGYWNSKDTEIDLVALDQPGRRIRFGSCKREPDRLLSGAGAFEGHVGRFLQAFPKYSGWTVEKVLLAPELTAEERKAIVGRGYLAQDLNDLTAS